MRRFILASASPRRRELLENIGLKFDIMVSTESEEDIDKNLPPELYCGELALKKACAVAKHVEDKNAYIIAADTVVFSDNVILGKPKDEKDAYNILKKLSSKEHKVYTGLCVMRMSDGYSVTRSISTAVKFKELSDEIIYGYIKTKEPYDKAGAYGIQGKGAVLVDKIEGDYFNVVGLPLSALYDVLKEEFDIDILN
ncbi:MAG: Maf family protein [Clostridia bacterium]|nr:Maf family protein [Clostridia bacterium]